MSKKPKTQKGTTLPFGMGGLGVTGWKNGVKILIVGMTVADILAYFLLPESLGNTLKFAVEHAENPYFGCKVNFLNSFF